MTIETEEVLIDRYPVQSKIVRVNTLPAIDDLIYLIDMPPGLVTKIRMKHAFERFILWHDEEPWHQILR